MARITCANFRRPPPDPSGEPDLDLFLAISARGPLVLNLQLLLNDLKGDGILPLQVVARVIRVYRFNHFISSSPS
jgi:hypothetical protein